MNLKSLLTSAPLLAVLLATPAVHADTLDVQKPNGRSTSDLPRRGMSMAQVEKRFGAPVDKLPTAGGDAPRHPPINRWRYNGYTVYFERNRVIHSVVDSGPAPQT